MNGTIEVKRERKGDNVATAMMFAGLIIFALLLIGPIGCMQAIGVKKMDLWGAKFEANNGIELSAGIQQYDNVQNMKGINNTNTTVTRGIKKP